MTIKGLRFFVLGPLRVSDDEGNEIHIVSARERKILAALLLAGGRAVSVDRLVDIVWPDEPPATARSQIQNCTGMLRKRIREKIAGAGLTGSPAGYRLELPYGLVDIDVFLRVSTLADEQMEPSDHEYTAGKLGDGLRLWQGRPAEDIDSVMLEPARAHLEEVHASCLVQYTNLLNDFGGQGAALAELRGWIDGARCNENASLALTRLLWHKGRPGEALSVLRRLRERLAAEYGLGLPPQALALQLEILNGSWTDSQQAGANGELSGIIQTLAQHLSVAGDLLVQLASVSAQADQRALAIG